MGISFIIPTYNERANIEACIERVRQFAKSSEIPVQIIVVDSGSTDGTSEYLKESESNQEDMSLIFQESRLGMGMALKEAYLHVSQEVVCHYECDCPFDLERVLMAYQLLNDNECEFVLGHRVGERDSLLRRIYTLGYRIFTYLLFGTSFKSINFSFKVFKSSVLKKISLNSKAWFIDAELVIEVNRHFRIKEIDVIYTKREHDQSTVRMLDVFHIMKEALEYKWKG
ncbi:glycosyltransferase family 2 protein [bacterium]|nr:glycosyltransferase family 2 protein [bacterium]